MKMKDLLKEGQSPYFSKQKVQKLIADIEQFNLDIEGDASIRRSLPNLSSKAIKTSKMFLSSLKSLLGAL